MPDRPSPARCSCRSLSLCQSYLRGKLQYLRFGIFLLALQGFAVRRYGADVAELTESWGDLAQSVCLPSPIGSSVARHELHFASDAYVTPTQEQIL